MKMKRVTILLCVALIAVGAVFAGGAQEEAEDGKMKIALILPGKVDDLSWNQAMYEGMKTVEKDWADRVSITYVEEVYEVADIEPALRDVATQGDDLVFGHGFQFMEPLVKMADQVPEVNFALGTGFKTKKNTCVYDIRLGQGGYLMGTLAGLMTETDKIGVVGGVDVSEIFRGHEAYKLAAKTVNPDVEIQELYTGDWRDAASAKEGAISMYESGADIIWHSGDGIGLGVVDAAKSEGKIALGNVVDQYPMAQENMLSGVVYDWAPIIKQIITDINEDNFTTRQEKFYWLTVANGGIETAPFHDFADEVPQDVKDKLEETKQGIIDGSIEIPHFEK